MVPKGSGLCKTTSNFIWGQLLLLGEGIPDPGDIFNTGSTLSKESPTRWVWRFRAPTGSARRRTPI